MSKRHFNENFMRTPLEFNASQPWPQFRNVLCTQVRQCLVYAIQQLAQAWLSVYMTLDCSSLTWQMLHIQNTQGISCISHLHLLAHRESSCYINSRISSTYNAKSSLMNIGLLTASKPFHCFTPTVKAIFYKNLVRIIYCVCAGLDRCY